MLILAAGGMSLIYEFVEFGTMILPSFNKGEALRYVYGANLATNDVLNPGIDGYIDLSMAMLGATLGVSLFSRVQDFYIARSQRPV